MNPENERKLESRVIRAAEQALADHQYVTAIDVFTGMGLLLPRQVEDWRKGRISFLERVTQGNLKRISLCMAVFRKWAKGCGLQPSETRYLRQTRGGAAELRFSKSGNPEIEKAYRTHYVSPVLAEQKRQKLEARLSRPAQRPVFSTIRDSQCSECGVELPAGSFLYMEVNEPLCLACAGLADLEYLSAGDAALTRRAARFSSKSIVVVRFSRTRKRYERQGILVEDAALRKAEEECTSDAEERARERARAAVLRQEQDQELVEKMTRRIQELFPRCPQEEARKIAAHTAVRRSGRVGRTAPGRALDEQALKLAVIAAVRHKHTDYDDLLAQGAERTAARERVRDRLKAVLQQWG